MKRLFGLDKLTATDVVERLEDVSADLPYELQSKMFDQLATVGVAGTGLSVTLISSLLRDAPSTVWIAVAFAIAALTSIDGNVRLINNLTLRRSAMRASKIQTGLAIAWIGVGAGFLSMEIYSAGDAKSAPVTEVGEPDSQSSQSLVQP